MEHCHADLQRTEGLDSLEILGRIPGADMDASRTVVRDHLVSSVEENE